MSKTPATEDNKTETIGNSFSDLCKELGKRVSSTENALLCHRAYQAYLVEHPDTARGKANKSDRDPAKSFRRAASAASGVAPATIDALLQVGKAIAPLPKKAQAALAGSSLGHSMRVLRKLATKKHAKDRARLITEFAKQEEADPKSAMASLKTKLGMKPGGRESVEAQLVRKPESQYFVPGEHLDVKVGRYLFRVEVGEMTGGRIHLTAMALTGEKTKVAKFLESVREKPELGSKPPKQARKEAA